ncbi:hypothetical protein H8N01_30805 [Streptomyces sp. AC536]|uniref:DUF6397 family protein n=1 Tax=Streptomyces buecherae TaxID=2763006 RepID=UPI00164E2299|nr:DUF6397 family protein [Streptomyces buecherae]MBC3986856.1 hypothetical protein [Streptomyces buecherae]QNJ43912.1 hypothetical protein H7H31_32855 [Streptomyces buecherae]
MTARAWETRTTVRATVSLGSAARELRCPRRELELAVQLGVMRSVGLGELAPWGRPAVSRDQRAPAVPGASWQRRVIRSEVERLAADPCALRALRGRLRLVGTARAAELLGISPGRFTRLARGGCVSPARFYVNRYRAVVWLYLAAELAEFASGEPELSATRVPERLRAMMRTEADWRGRNWRARRVRQLLAHSSDPWSRAAVSAAVLSTDALAEVVPDPTERACLRELDPPLSPVRAVAPAVCAVVDEVVTADDREEVIWHQIGLATALEDARPTSPAALPATGEAAVLASASERRALSAARPALASMRASGDRRSDVCRAAPSGPATPAGPPPARPGTAWEFLARAAAARRAREAESPRRVTSPAARAAVGTRERTPGPRGPVAARRRPGGADLSSRRPTGGAGGRVPPA